MISINEFGNRELQKLDIHELRALARQIGVSSPTSKKKGDLIDCIMSIVTGKTVPEFKNINRGRPCKQSDVNYSIENYKPIFAINEFTDDFMVASPKDDYSLNKKNTVVSGVISFEKQKKYIRKFKFAETLDDVTLDDEVIELYGLKENDVVTYTKNENGINIYTINGISANANGILMLNGKKIILGKRNIVFASSITEKRSILLGLANVGKVIHIPSNHLSVASAPNITTIPLEATTDEEIINNFCAGCDIAQFYKSGGGNVLFVADNFLSVISATKQFSFEKSAELETEVFSKIENLIESGITFVGMVPSMLNQIFKNMTTTFDNMT